MKGNTKEAEAALDRLRARNLELQRLQGDLLRAGTPTKAAQIQRDIQAYWRRVEADLKTVQTARTRTGGRQLKLSA